MTMLTAKENMREVIRGGNPDRLVNQYEAINLLFHPFIMFGSAAKGHDQRGQCLGCDQLLPGEYAWRVPCPLFEPTKAIDKYNTQHFGFTQQLEDARMPVQIMF